MRGFLFGPVVLFAGWLWLAPPAGAQSAVAVHQAAPVAATAAPKPSAIIPGSPLAVLTGAGKPAAPAAPAAADANTPTPFGTGNLGTAVLTQVGDEATKTIDEFFAAVRKSTELTPVVNWLGSFASDAPRRARAGLAAKALAVVILPAVTAEILTRLALRWPRAALVRRALANRQRDLPADDESGLEAAEANETEETAHGGLSFMGWVRRLGLASAYILMALLPLVVFILVAAGLLNAGVVDSRASRLIIIGTANAFLACRLIYETLRFFLAPQTAALRLIHTSDKRAKWVVRSVCRLAVVAAVGYVVISSAEILGLPHAGQQVLTWDIGLLLHIQAAVMVWQSRRIVAGWIRGKQRPGVTFAVRARLAGIWHFLALFYILALWVALAGGVQNAFGVLLRVILVFVGAVVLGRVSWLGATHLLDRLFADAQPDGPAHRHPGLLARAQVYHPLIKFVIRILIGLLMLVFMLQGWGIGALQWLLRNPLSLAILSACIAILVTIAIALVVWEILNGLLNGWIERLAGSGQTRRASRLRTLLPMLKATLGVVIFLTAGLICLSKIGVNAAPLLAGAGVLGIAIGFGSQKLVQDIITGLFLLLEDAMQVGDVVSLAGMSGTVEKLSIRTIRLRGGDGSINIIPFSAVTTVTNQTRDFGYAQISIQVGYEEDLQRVYDAMREVSKKMRAEPAWGAMMRDDLQIFGLDQFGASALVITGQIRTGPGQHWAVRREYYARVKRRFEADHIDMPYTYLPPPPPLAPPDAARDVPAKAETAPSDPA